MNTHYLFLVFHEINGEHIACLHNFEAASEREAWDAVDRYLTEKGITTIVMSALEGFPTEKAMSATLKKVLRTLMAGARPKRVNMNVTAAPRLT